MSKKLDAIKAFGAKCNTGGTAPDGNTIAEVFADIAENFNITGAKGDKGNTGAKGDTGAHVTAISLVTTGGAVTGGTATLSDNTTVDITVTATDGGES